jgi:transcriptional antiterminator NusG
MAKWYIVHTQSGSENRVKQMVLEQVARHGMEDSFEEIVIPVVEIPEVKRGKAIKVEKKLMPGYVLIKMVMTDKSWHLVKSVPKISGFLGSKSVPKALSEKEVDEVFSQLENRRKNINSTSLYEIGESVTVLDGPFEGFSGTVEEIDEVKMKLRIAISIFGKATPIDLGFSQIKKVNDSGLL